jgi:hypothetical protein
MNAEPRAGIFGFDFIGLRGWRGGAAGRRLTLPAKAASNGAGARGTVGASAGRRRGEGLGE